MTALPDSANKQQLSVNEFGRKRVNETGTVLDKHMGSREQLTSGSETVVNDDNEGRALCRSALESASFLALD